jgi:hypothetical protein
MDIVGIILDILKYTLPSLIVFATAYYLLKQYLNHQTVLKSMEIKSKDDNTLTAVKLQAYERLTLFLERIMPYNLYLRLNNSELNAKTLQNAMLIALQQEYEHNLTQQVYISNNLWKIIKLAKDQTVDIISQCGDHVYNTEGTDALMNKINKVMNELKINPIEQAKAAIKKELELVIG